MSTGATAVRYGDNKRRIYDAIGVVAAEVPVTLPTSLPLPHIVMDFNTSGVFVLEGDNAQCVV